MIKNGLAFLNPENTGEVRSVADLHARLLPESPIPKLGRLFMEKFYYRTLVREKWIHCLTFYAGGQCVGFMSYTEHPFTFMEEAKRRHFLGLGLLLLWSVVLRPGRLKVIGEVMRQSRGRKFHGKDPATGELLSIGILAEHTETRDLKTQKRVPQLLCDTALRNLAALDKKKTRMIIRKNNKLSLLLFHSYGAHVIREGLHPMAPEGSYLLEMSLNKERCFYEDRV